MSVARNPFAAQRARNARLRDQADQLARSMAGTDGDAHIPLAMVPANTRALTPLPADARRAFLERLDVTIHKVLSAATGTRGADEAKSASAGARLDSPAMTSILGRSCATCRGKCCTSGGDHAFLRDDTIERVHREHPLLDAPAMLAQYASHLPTEHFAGSCVYHASDGCGLPRTLRSDLCNRYECGGLTQLRSALTGVEPPSVFVAAADAFSLQRMALVDGAESRPVALN